MLLYLSHSLLSDITGSYLLKLKIIYLCHAFEYLFFLNLGHEECKVFWLPLLRNKPSQ